MDLQTIAPPPSVSLFVKAILVFEEGDNARQTVLPFFADGYPGLLYHQTPGGLVVNPHGKPMPPLFLYGQTIQPVELVTTGASSLLLFQLYPFVLQSFFNIIPKDLNDQCYDLAQLPNEAGTRLAATLQAAPDVSEQINLLASFLEGIFCEKGAELDLPIALAIQEIIRQKGKLLIGPLCRELHLTERTFERRFFSAVGVSAKQFSKMIQFQHSLAQLTTKEYTKLSDVVYANGYADQSHFIKVFKAFTGKTPLAFQLEAGVR